VRPGTVCQPIRQLITPLGLVQKFASIKNSFISPGRVTPSLIAGREALPLKMSYIDRTISILREDGFFALLKEGVPFVYNRHIAPLLPRTNAVYNGVDVNAARQFDSILPWRDKDRPDYESGLVSGLKNELKEGEHIIIVGGGMGRNSRQSRPNGGPLRKGDCI
jgi:hypothetical protein